MKNLHYTEHFILKLPPYIKQNHSIYYLKIMSIFLLFIPFETKLVESKLAFFNKPQLFSSQLCIFYGYR